MYLKRFFVSVISAVCLCASLGITVSAETASAYSLVDIASPFYAVADQAYSDIEIVGNKAECVSRAYGDQIVKITVEQTLEKYSGWFWIWNNVDGASWTKTVNMNTIRLSNTKSGLTSGTYRLKSVFTLTSSSGKTETITIYSAEKTVG